MPSKSDARRESHKLSLGFNDNQVQLMTNVDLERRIRGTALGLSEATLANKSINDLRTLQGVRADDA